jgi:hypothetical protein
LFNSGASVNLTACSAPVSVYGFGTSYTPAVVTLGQAAPHGGMTTSGINASVSVMYATLVVDDSGNATTSENVTVSSPDNVALTISGTGLFGNNQVQVTDTNEWYGPNSASIPAPAGVTIRTGQLADKYTLASGGSGAFTDFNIEIDNYSKVGLQMMVLVDSGSQLHLNLKNTLVAHQNATTLFISAPGAQFSPLVSSRLKGEVWGFGLGFTNEVIFDGAVNLTTAS